MGFEKVDWDAIEQKIQNNETLTAEEEKAVLGSPPDKDETDDDPMDDSEYDDLDGDSPKKKKETADGDPTGSGKDKDAEAGEEEKGKKDETVSPEEMSEEELREEMNNELSKPPSERRKDYSKRERAYFHEVKTERKKRQRIEKENETLKFKLMQRDAKAQIKDTEPDEDKKEDTDVDPDGFITQKEAKELIEKTAGKVNQPDQTKTAYNRNFNAYLNICKREGLREYEDFEEVMECYDKIVANDPVYLDRLGRIIEDGENCLVEAYKIIKADPEFGEVIVEAREKLRKRTPTSAKKPEPKPSKEQKEKEEDADPKKNAAEKKEKKIEENLSKIKTSSSFPGGAGGADGAEITLADISRMTQEDFDALPKATRDKLVRRFGY